MIKVKLNNIEDHLSVDIGYAYFAALINRETGELHLLTELEAAMYDRNAIADVNKRVAILSLAERITSTAKLGKRELKELVDKIMVLR